MILQTSQYKLKLLVVLFFLALTSGCATAPKEIKKTPEIPETEKDGAKKSSGGDVYLAARSQLGTKYHYGGNSPETGFDCSGLAYWSHYTNGIFIPRSSFLQFESEDGKEVDLDELQKGDLVYFQTYKKGASHVGIYDGNKGFIHAPKTGKPVMKSTLDNPYWKKQYMGARRFW